MGEITIEEALANIRKNLHLSKETENELLDEIRAHLEDAVADARERGGDEQIALQKVIEQFGIQESLAELQQEHASWDSIDAIIATALPVLFAVVLRWLAFAPDGSALNWPRLLVQPGFWVVAIAALILPYLRFHRWRIALVGWAVFWLLTVIFVQFPSINQW